MAPNPFVRYVTSMMYLSKVNGLSRINYPNSEFMKSINFEELKRAEKPHIFHNAWNLDEQKLALFSNRANEKDKPTVQVRGAYRRALFMRMLGSSLHRGNRRDRRRLHTAKELWSIRSTSRACSKSTPNLDEIWVSRIVDSKQIRKPENLHDALANLCQLFAATVGEDDVKLFKYHIRCDKPGSRKDGKNGNGKKKWNGTVVEIHVPGHINFKWNHSNLDNGRVLGRAAAEQAIEAYEAHAKLKAHAGPHFINEDPEIEHPKGWENGTRQVS